jgi:kynurenine formamidase
MIIDLSLPIDDEAFEAHKVSIERVSHKEGIEKFNAVMGKSILKKSDLPDEEFLSLETVHAPVHIGTHLDYSFHYGSRSEGRASKTADEIPLEYCYQDGVRLDMTHKRPNEAITSRDIAESFRKINYRLKALDIVLLYTGADRFFGTKQYFSDYPGVDISAIDYLLDRGVKIFGVDAMGIDRPYRFMLKEFLEKKDSKYLYPAHFYGRKREFIHIERLTNLIKLPDFCFKVICFPVRIKRTGASWARVVAIIN